MLHIFVIVSNFAMLAYAFVIRKAASTKSEPSTFELFRLMIRAKLRTAADN
jgi:hypothetical protein